MKTLKFIIFLYILIVIGFNACKKSESNTLNPTIPNEEEVITTLEYTLTPANGGDPVVMTFRDLDGDGGNAPDITGAVLASNTAYMGAITLKNESESPAENVTEEIDALKEEHQFFFQVDPASALTIGYNDTDSAGNPVGLTTNLTANNAGSCNLTIILRHEPDKTASGVSSGDITNAGGSTDIEVTFNVLIQ